LKKPRYIVIVANWKKEQVKAVAQEISVYLHSISIPCMVFKTFEGYEVLECPSQTDLVISLGGDGTVLYCVRYLQDLGIPIMAVNIGTFGYITEISASEWRPVLDSYLEGNDTGYAIHRRLTIKANVVREGKTIFNGTALNEVAVGSYGITKVVSLGMCVDDTCIGSFRADGMIVATPTGSTGYNLAAGGPIVDVNLSALIITPICPFTLSNRPLVVSGDSSVCVNVLSNQRTDLMVSLDGQVNFNLEEGDEIEIEKSRSKALLITPAKRTGFDIIRDKLHWSGGGITHA
jgi:NAD+ kinase